MKKIDLVYEKLPIKRILEKCLNDETKNSIKTYFVGLEEEGKSILSSIRALKDISEIYEEDEWLNKLNGYVNTNSQKEKILIRKGNLAKEQYENKLKSRPSPKNPFSIFDKNYWITKGYGEQESIKKVSEIQKKNAQKRSKKSYSDHKKKLKYSLEYWIDLGYTKEESEILRRLHLQKMLTDKKSLILRHGKRKGKEIYKKKIEKFKLSYRKNYHNKKSAGYVSKESLRFFIPLYKKCRKLGIERKDIYLGVNGSKEFFIRHDGIENNGRFFDFCIHPLKIVIEYNGVFWHPRSPKTWKNPWINYDDAIAIEKEKELLCEKRGYRLIKVWSDEDIDIRIKEIFTEVKKTYERYIT